MNQGGRHDPAWRVALGTDPVELTGSWALSPSPICPAASPAASPAKSKKTACGLLLPPAGPAAGRIVEAPGQPDFLKQATKAARTIRLPPASVCDVRVLHPGNGPQRGEHQFRQHHEGSNLGRQACRAVCRARLASPNPRARPIATSQPKAGKAAAQESPPPARACPHHRGQQRAAQQHGQRPFVLTSGCLTAQHHVVQGKGHAAHHTQPVRQAGRHWQAPPAGSSNERASQASAKAQQPLRVDAFPAPHAPAASPTPA